MIAFKITVNGKPYGTVGQKDWEVLAAHVSASKARDLNKPDDHLRFNVGGLTMPNEEGTAHHFRWNELDLVLTDKVEIEVIETDAIDPPVKRYRSDASRQESPFTEEEMREMRYQDYLELKKEFEST